MASSTEIDEQQVDNSRLLDQQGAAAEGSVGELETGFQPIKKKQTCRREDLKWKAYRIKYLAEDFQAIQNVPTWVMWLFIKYLTKVRGESLIYAAATVNLFEASSAIFALLVNFLINTWVGEYIRSLLFAIIYATGLSLLWSIALSKSDSDKLFYSALCLTALGRGGTKVTLMPFYNRQLKNYKVTRRNTGAPKPNMCLSFEFFVYTVISVVIMAGNFVILFLSSWKVLFGVASVTTVYSCCKLLIGCNVFDIPADRGHDDGKVREEDNKDLGSINYKKIWRVLGTWTTFLLPCLIVSLGCTYFLEQADGMEEEKLFSFLPVTLIVLFPCFAAGYFGAKATLEKNKDDQQPMVCLGWGAICSILCCVIAALVELIRLSVIKKHGTEEPIPMSAFWLVPQFLCLGFVYGYTDIGVILFFMDQLPRQMKKHAGLFTNVSFGLGAALSVLLVYLAQTASSFGGNSSGWFGTTINTTRLDYFFWTLAVLSVLNLFFICVFAYNYDSRTPTSSFDFGLEEQLEDIDNPLTFFGAIVGLPCLICCNELYQED